MVSVSRSSGWHPFVFVLFFSFNSIYFIFSAAAVYHCRDYLLAFYYYLQEKNTLTLTRHFFSNHSVNLCSFLCLCWGVQHFGATIGVSEWHPRGRRQRVWLIWFKAYSFRRPTFFFRFLPDDDHDDDDEGQMGWTLGGFFEFVKRWALDFSSQKLFN